jgi:hypothetical protein
MKRIKHNDLTHYFLRPHSELPQAYLASCEEFFKWLADCKRAGFQAPSKQQAVDKRQASSYSRIIKENKK